MVLCFFHFLLYSPKWLLTPTPSLCLPPTAQGQHKLSVGVASGCGLTFSRLPAAELVADAASQQEYHQHQCHGNHTDDGKEPRLLHNPLSLLLCHCHGDRVHRTTPLCIHGADVKGVCSARCEGGEGQGAFSRPETVPGRCAVSSDVDDLVAEDVVSLGGRRGRGPPGQLNRRGV